MMFREEGVYTIMREESEHLSYSLNTLDGLGQQLAQALSQIYQGHDTAQQIVGSLLDAVADVRLGLDRVVNQSTQVWNGLLYVADRSLTTTDSCPSHIRELFETAFSQLGYSIFGLPGCEIDVLENYEVVGSQGSPGSIPVSIVQTLQIGLRSTDGTITRFPRVVVSCEKNTTGEQKQS